ncbi:hypothetical protein EDC96DRAFT_543221 [Choanephora cucurbitarum]|nr:hypothetical protein EDC96DRAFT_543221 [Choanephora cucurbitarum]
MSRTQVRKHVYVKPTIKVVKNLSCHGLQASFQVSTSRSPFTVIKTGLLQERCGVQQVLMLGYQAQTQAKQKCLSQEKKKKSFQPWQVGNSPTKRQNQSPLAFPTRSKQKGRLRPQDVRVLVILAVLVTLVVLSWQA